MDGTALARELMLDFAEATGVAGARPPRRYLWTDAFATCNLLGLERETGEARFLDLALKLVDQVHHVLGRHREDDGRKGWLSGLSEEDGERHPTRGGLRIGKPLPERAPGEPLDTALEWDRDGQYLHYLTKWMHALLRTGQATGDRRFLTWGVELAETAHARFSLREGPSGPRLLAWKMSVDLSRPLVPSTGQHDALDLLATCLDLRAAAGGDALATEIADLDEQCRSSRWATSDALGAGGLLVDALRLGGLVARGDAGRRALLHDVLDAAIVSLRAVERTGLLEHPASARLPFRELGLSIGLHAADRLRTAAGLDSEARTKVESIARWIPLAAAIESTWTPERSRAHATWTDHEDINAVMLATSLSPDGFLASRD